MFSQRMPLYLLNHLIVPSLFKIKMIKKEKSVLKNGARIIWVATGPEKATPGPVEASQIVHPKAIKPFPSAQARTDWEDKE